MPRPRILIAEDDDLQGTVVQTALQSRGYDAEIVSDGLEAVRRLRTGHYDLAVLDYHLPEVDGLAAARLLHELLSIEDRPRLIAITASAEGLVAKEGACGGAFFDAVVSKRLGLPALLTVVDANMASAAERQRASVLEAGRQAALDAAARRRRRWRAPLAAMPALGMAALFTTAFGWAAMSLRHLDMTMAAADRSGALTVNTGALLGAVQDAENSQRAYLATGQARQLDQFRADAQHVDQLLIAPAALASDGAPGLGGGPEPQATIQTRLRTLAAQAQSRSAGAPADLPVDHGDIERLRDWAAGVVSGAQLAVFSGLAAIRNHIEWVRAALAAGICYGVGDAIWIVRRRWRSPPARTGPVQTAGAWKTPGPAAIDAPDGAPVLLIDG